MRKGAIVSLGTLLFVFFLISCGSQKKVNVGVQNFSQQENSESQKRIEERSIIEAANFKMLGKYDEAEKVYQGLLKQNPNNDVALFELARIKDVYNQYEAARSFIDKAVTINNSNKWYYLLQAELYQKTKHYELLPQVYENLVRLEPQNHSFLEFYANAYIINEKYNDALQVLQRLEDLFGVNEKLTIKRKDIYLSQGKAKKALKELQKLCDKYPDNQRYHSMMAELYLKEGMDKKALACYNKVLEIAPEDPYIHFTLADFHRKKNHFDESFKHLKQGFLTEQLDADSKIQLLLKFYDLDEMLSKNRKVILELVEILVQMHPESVKANSLHADLLIREKQFDQAYTSLKRILKKDQSQYIIWESTLGIALELKKYKELDKTAENCSAIFPYQPLPYLYRGIAQAQLKDFEGAIKSLTKGQNYVFDQNSLKAQFFSQIGDCYHELKNNQQSDLYYDKSLQLEPENIYVLNNYSYFLALRGEKLNKAKTMIEKAIAIDSNNSNFTDTYGWVLFKMGNYIEAEKWIAKAMNDSVNPSAVVLEHYGDVQFKLNNIDKALTYWKKALKLESTNEILKKKINTKKID